MATRHYADHAVDEESYFVSMTDVFIGLLFIFIIMLMFFAMRFRRDPPPTTPSPQADARPSSIVVSGPPRDNLDLSALRATSTFRELLRVKKELSLYLSPTGQQVLSVSGYGEYRPVSPVVGETPEAFKQRNRRIDLRILMATPRSEDAKQFQRELQHPEVRR